MQKIRRSLRQLATTAGLVGIGVGLVACGSETSEPAAETAAATVDEDWVANAVPVIQGIRFEPREPSSNGRVRAIVQALDADGDTLRFGYVWRVDGRRVASSGDALALAGASRGDSVSVTVTATDGFDESAPSTATTRVGNTAPVLQKLVLEPLGPITRAHDVTAVPDGRDPDGDELEYHVAWFVNGRRVGSGATLETRGLRVGDAVEVEVVARDGRAESNVIRSAAIEVSNSAPVVVSSPRFESDGAGVRYQIEAQDPDGDRSFRYRMEKGPAGMTVDRVTGLVSWDPPADATGTHPISVVIEDRDGAFTRHMFSITIEDEAGAPAAPAP